MEKITLKALRVNKHLNLNEASELLGISVQTLHEYENAKTFPKVPMINKICEFYGTHYDNIDFLCK